MLKLLWLLGQVHERPRSRALRRLTPLLKRRDLGKTEFLRSVLEVTRDLEHVHSEDGHRDAEPQNPHDAQAAASGGSRMQGR